MLDVIHYYFDDDLSSVYTAEHAEAKDESRTMLYRIVYGREYLFAARGKRRSAADFDFDDPLDDVPLDFDPLAPDRSTKAFTPPTPFNPDSRLPFGSVIDAPLG
jgi:hypothetical protein